MADDGFVTAVDRSGRKRRVPKHFVTNPAMGYKLPATIKATEPAKPDSTPKENQK